MTEPNQPNDGGVQHFLHEYRLVLVLIACVGLVLLWATGAAENWGNVASVVGLFLTLYTMWEAFQARLAAGRAETAASLAVQRLTTWNTATAARRAAAQLKEARRHSSNGDVPRAADALGAAWEILVELNTRLEGQQHQIPGFSKQIDKLHKVQREVELVPPNTRGQKQQIPPKVFDFLDELYAMLLALAARTETTILER